ncbi:MAG: glycosyltransferase family 4 protein [Actinomycetota bacterium]
MLTILQVITDRDRRGAQVFATDLHGAVEASGAEVSTVALAPGSHGDQLDVDTLGPTRRSTTTLRELRRRAARVDVVIAHGSTTLPMSALALTRSSTPFVYRQISDPGYWAGSWSRRERTALFLRRAAAVVALSDDTADLVAQHFRLPRQRIRAIPNAVPEHAFQPATEEDRRVARSRLGLSQHSTVAAYVGALVPEKGVDRAIQAVRSTDDLYLVIAGDGPERARLGELVPPDQTDRVRFVGSVDDPRVVYAAADFLALPSRAGDSMPAVLIEAGLCGVPSISTDVGAIGDVVVDGVTGIMLDSADDAGVIRAFGAMTANAQQRRAYGDAALSHCRSGFTIEATAPTWIDVCQEAADGV